MEKITRDKDESGQNVIYVEKCKKYKYENPNVPPNPINRYGVYIKPKNEKNSRIDDIINKENVLP